MDYLKTGYESSDHTDIQMDEERIIEEGLVQESVHHHQLQVVGEMLEQTDLLLELRIFDLPIVELDNLGYVLYQRFGYCKYFLQFEQGGIFLLFELIAG